MAKHKIWNTDSAAKEVANLWGGIEGEQLTMMKTHIQVTKYKKGEIIYENGTIPKEAMCLLAGKVKIYKDGINGKSRLSVLSSLVNFWDSVPILPMKPTELQQWL